MPATIFVTGATGLIGRRLVATLAARGDRVLALSRKPPEAAHSRAGSTHIEPVVGDPVVAGPWLDRLAEVDAVVHLAGENVFAHRWSDRFMKQLRDSRINSTRLIAEALAKAPRRADGTPKVFVSASAVGYYGPRGDEELTEESPAGKGFMADLCRDWEEAARPAAAAGVRVCHPRFGVVLDPAGGALPTMARPFRLFMGGPAGSGRQWVSWIHHADLTGLLLFLFDTPAAAGPVNATAPNPARNRDLSRALAKQLGRPYWLPAPAFALRLALGKVAEAVVTGQRVLPAKALALGYRFRFPELVPALADALAPQPPVATGGL